MNEEELQKLTIKGLRPLAKSLGIKYSSWMKKKEMINEIIKYENGDKQSQDGKYKQKYSCEHNKQKYKCILCDGSHICEHKKQRPACKDCSKPKDCRSE